MAIHLRPTDIAKMDSVIADIHRGIVLGDQNRNRKSNYKITLSALAIYTASVVLAGLNLKDSSSNDMTYDLAGQILDACESWKLANS